MNTTTPAKDQAQQPALANSQITDELVKCKYLQEELTTRIYELFRQLYGDDAGTDAADEIAEEMEPIKERIDKAVIYSIDNTIDAAITQ